MISISNPVGRRATSYSWGRPALSLQDEMYIIYTQILGNPPWNFTGAFWGGMLAFEKQVLVQTYFLLLPWPLVAPSQLTPLLIHPHTAARLRSLPNAEPSNGFTVLLEYYLNSLPWHLHMLLPPAWFFPTPFIYLSPICLSGLSLCNFLREMSLVYIRPVG